MTAVRLTGYHDSDRVTVELIGDQGQPIGRGTFPVEWLTTMDSVEAPITADGLPGDPSPLSVSGPLTPRPLGEAGAPVELPDATPRCRWYAMCENPPAGWIDHPVMGPVPACQRCADKHGFTLLDQEP